MYRTVTHLSEITDTSTKTVRKRIKQMRDSGLYPETVILTDPLRADLEAYLHFDRYKRLIFAGLPVPEFRRI